MAANKFATMLHRNTNKMTLILIYTVLEWVLIVLLLLNSLFSYLIIKFADYFGLKTPCLWCSRVDHLLDPENSKNSHRDLLCEAHAAEISKLGYCSNHRKLAESRDMCEDCSSSRPAYNRVSRNLAFVPWLKDVGIIQSEGDKATENGEVGLECSCCGVSLDSEIYSPCTMIKPSWGILDYTHKGDLITEPGDGDHIQIEESDSWDRSRSDYQINRCLNEDWIEEKGEGQILSEVNEGCGARELEPEVDCFVSAFNSGLIELEAEDDYKREEPTKEDSSNSIMEDPSSCETMNQTCGRQDASLEILSQHLEFFVGHGGHRLIPIELIDSATEENQIELRIMEEDDVNSDNHTAFMGSESHEEAQVEPIVDNKANLVGETEAELSANEVMEEAKYAVLESMEIEEDENSFIFHTKECDLVREVYEHVETQSTSNVYEYDEQETATAAAGERDSHVPTVTEETFQMPLTETEIEVSIGTEIPDLEPTDEFQNQETLAPYTCINEGSSTSSANCCAVEVHGSRQAEEESVEFRAMLVEVRQHVMNNQTSRGSELNEIEEDKVPDTPTSMDSLHHLHKKLLSLEKREYGNEESLDGSVISDFEGVEGVTTSERLKSALRAERKALHALYVELEEERSASAVAANQTMAMINRLQEEKAAMQMEALQYQRMMEEQSEYDQEALQLLNELMVKREREKQEVERELEVYRKKVLEYESKEKMRALRRSKDGSARSLCSCASSSNAGDFDVLSIDLNHEAKEENSCDQENGHHNTPVDAVLNLEESLANFEEERLSILDQLKVLEDKLFTLTDEEDQHFEEIKPIENLYKENGKHTNGNSEFDGQELHGIVNGFPMDMTGKWHQEGRIIGATGKRLLPLFNAILAENDDTEENGHVSGIDSDSWETSPVKGIELENKKTGIQEEVDHLYERLQALEADREFLKHCVGSLKKGDKGMDLLQEILEHLRDLRNVELRVRNFSDGALASNCA